MTTAARPTFNPAMGGTQRNEGALAYQSVQYSSQDLPGHKKLKHRQPGQGTVDDVRSRDFRSELEDREHRYKSSKRGAVDDTSYSSAQSSSGSAKKPRVEAITPANLDADEPLDESDKDSSDDEDEDDTAELMAELNRIKKEREAEQNKKDEVKKVEEERIRMDNLLHGNPLLSKKAGDFTVKRRWDDDVVFKNCAKGQDERNKQKTFINDSLRSEFHKKFMDKYIK